MAGFWSWAENTVIMTTIIIVTILIGIIAAKMLGRTTKQILAQAEVNRLLKQSGIKAIDQRVAAIVEYVIYGITALIVLRELGLTKIALAILIIGGAATIGISAALALRNVVPNLIHGIKARKHLKDRIGKEIRIGMVRGKLAKIGITQSIMIDKEKHYVPHTYTAKQLQAD